MNPMTAVVPGPGLPLSGTPTTSPSVPTAEAANAAPELSSAGGDGPSHPSGIHALTATSSYDDEGGSDSGATGTREVIAHLATATRERA
jgi:hypothetical protein